MLNGSLQFQAMAGSCPKATFRLLESGPSTSGMQRRLYLRAGNDWCPITLLQWYGRQTVVMPLGNQTGDLRTAVAGGALQIHSQHTTLSFAPLGKVEALEYPTDVFIAVA